MLRILLTFAMLTALWLPQAVQASFLRIQGRSEFTVTADGDTIRLRGEYVMKNEGDESARRVFPSFQLGKWSWAGEPRDIERDQEHAWQIDSALQRSDLQCADVAACAGLDLAARGLFPLLTRRHYEDANGMRYSAADVEIIEIGPLDEGERSRMRAPSLDAKMECSGNGDGAFVCAIEMLNSSQSDQRVALSLHVPAELQSKQPAQQVLVPAGATTRVRAALANFSGRPGSSYAVFGVMQWEQGGVRGTQRVFSQALITEPERANWYLPAAAAAVAILALLLYFAVFKPKARA